MRQGFFDVANNQSLLQQGQYSYKGRVKNFLLAQFRFFKSCSLTPQRRKEEKVKYFPELGQLSHRITEVYLFMISDGLDGLVPLV